MIRIYEIQTANYKRDPDWEKAREKALTNCNQQSFHPTPPKIQIKSMHFSAYNFKHKYLTLNDLYHQHHSKHPQKQKVIQANLRIKKQKVHTSGSKPMIFICSTKQKASCILAPFMVPTTREWKVSRVGFTPSSIISSYTSLSKKFLPNKQINPI